MGAPVDGENSPEYRNLLVQVHRRTEDVAGGVSFDAKSIPDWRREEHKTREEWMEANGGIPLLTDLCLAMRSDPMGLIRGFGEVLTCIYGPAMTYAFRIRSLRHTATQWCT